MSKQSAGQTATELARERNREAADRTLMAWYANFSQIRDEVVNDKHLGYRFYRIWKYYLLSCAALFRARHAQLVQMVLSPGGVGGGYRRVS